MGMSQKATGLSERGPQDYETPLALFKQLDAEFHFTVDAAADAENSLCERYWDEEMDGLAQDWSSERVFCNPPFGTAKFWAAKASADNGLAVLLVPAAIDTRWWHEGVVLGASEVRFIAGRVNYGIAGEAGKIGLPMACAVVVWSPKEYGPPRVRWAVSWSPGRLRGWTDGLAAEGLTPL